MAAFKVIGIILLAFLLISFLRVGAIFSLGEELCVKLRIGTIRLTIFPKDEKEPKKTEEKPKKERKEKKPETVKKKRAIPKPTICELFDLADTALTALRETAQRACKRLHIDPLELSVVFGGEDPANIAILYGAASSAMYALMPRAEDCFQIPAPSMHLRMDYHAQSTSIEGKVGLSLRICDLFAVFFTLAIPLLKWFLRLKKAHRNDAPDHKGVQASKATEQTEQTA